MLNHTKRQGNIKTTTMFITAVCIVFMSKEVLHGHVTQEQI